MRERERERVNECVRVCVWKREVKNENWMEEVRPKLKIKKKVEFSRIGGTTGGKTFIESLLPLNEQVWPQCQKPSLFFQFHLQTLK